MRVLWILLVPAVIVIALFIFASRRVSSARRSGLLPAAGQANMADVERLVRSGQHIMAIRCYREIHHCGLAEAKHAVDDLRSTT